MSLQPQPEPPELCHQEANKGRAMRAPSLRHNTAPPAVSMKIAMIATLMAFVLILAGAAEQTAMVHGYVLDSACAFTKNLDKPVSRSCARACAKAGSPLVILGDDGNIYWPISSATPAASQNPKLMKLAGERVTASGKVFQRGGSRAIVIEKVALETTKK